MPDPVCAFNIDFSRIQSSILTSPLRGKSINCRLVMYVIKYLTNIQTYRKPVRQGFHIRYVNIEIFLHFSLNIEIYVIYVFSPLLRLYVKIVLGMNPYSDRNRGEIVHIT